MVLVEGGNVIRHVKLEGNCPGVGKSGGNMSGECPGECPDLVISMKAVAVY